jgi:hypothetical protein
VSVLLRREGDARMTGRSVTTPGRALQSVRTADGVDATVNGAMTSRHVRA